MAFIPSGALTKGSKIENLAFGKIMEFVPKQDNFPMRLVALVKNFKYKEKEGVFFYRFSCSRS